MIVFPVEEAAWITLGYVVALLHLFLFLSARQEGLTVAPAELF